MFFLTRGLPLLLEVGLTIYCLIECARTPSGYVRNLPKWVWITLILVIPLVGSIIWLLAGRPHWPDRNPPWPPRPVDGLPLDELPWNAPEPLPGAADAEFLRQMREVNLEQEQTLKRWEEDLRRREKELRERRSGGDDS